MRDLIEALSATVTNAIVAFDSRLLRHPGLVAERLDAYWVWLGLLAVLATLLAVLAVRPTWRRLLPDAFGLAAAALLPAAAVLAWDRAGIGRLLSAQPDGPIDPAAIARLLEAERPLLWLTTLLVAAAGSAAFGALRVVWRRGGPSLMRRGALGAAALVAIAVAALVAARLLPSDLRRLMTQLSGGESREVSVDVLFGTDRQKTIAQSGGAAGWTFGGARGKSLTLGIATVTIPRSHRRGKIETPVEFRLLGLTLHREAPDPQRHFILAGLELKTREAFLEAIRQRRRRAAMVFIHGFNTSFEAGVFRTAQLFHDLDFPGLPYFYSWPSRGGIDQYVSDRSSSEQAQPYLRQFLELVIRETGAEEVHIIAHSMGNMPLLRVLRDMRDALSKGGGARVRQIVLAAPDVDRDIFEQLATAVTDIGDVTLYASRNDRAMAVSRLIGVVQAGDVSDSGPVIVERVDTIDASAASTDLLALNHSGYAESPELLTDISELLVCGTRPPSQRANAFDEVPTANGSYWRLQVRQDPPRKPRTCR